MPRIFSLILSFALLAPFSLAAQTSQPAAPSDLPHPQAKQAAGAAADKVWVNTKSGVYHCPGERYYGKTKEGKYMTEPEARKAGYKGVRGETCFK